MKMNILITKLLAAFLFVTPLVANASVVVYAYKGSSTTTGGNRSIVIAHTGTLVLDADPTSEAYLSGTYVGQFALGSGITKVTYFTSRTFESDMRQFLGTKGSSYTILDKAETNTILAKAETTGSDYTGSVLHFEKAKGINSAIKIKTSGESEDLHLPKTLVSKAYIITKDGTEDYATEASGTYKFDKVKTVGFNDAKTTLPEAVSELKKTYIEKKYLPWDASILPGMPTPTPTPTPDKEAPVITLKGDNPMTVSVGESFTDPGADVRDNVDVARVISGNGTVDRNVPGTYTLNYSASDTAGNAAVAKTRSVVVVDKEAPMITLKGDNPMTVSVGESFTDPGADVSDNVDGDRFISGNGTVNTAVPGTYTLTYSGSDAAGNAATALTRSVVVSSIVSVLGGTLPSGSELSGQTVAAFQIGVCEVTYSEWQSVRDWAVTKGYTDLDAGAGVGNYPVTNVSWYAAVKWCNAKSEQEGLTPVYTVNGTTTTYKTGTPSGSDPLPTVNETANGYRLPTEKEWEWAARGGVNSLGYTYSGSNSTNSVAWTYDNSSGGTKAVGTKAGNEIGIYDMSGNVWEWCWDLVPQSDKRRRRGGAFNNYKERSMTKSGSQDHDAPTASFTNLGFRWARNSTK